MFPDYQETLEEFRLSRSRRHARGLADALVVAEGPGGQIAGYSHFNHMMGQYDPGRYHANVFVDTAWQGRGVGSTLFEHMTTVLAARGARVIESFAQETRPEVIGFLTHRGFRESLRNWELRLDLSRFDPARFSSGGDRARSAGVKIVTLAEERARDPEAMRRAYGLREAVMADIPAPIPYTPVPFDEFVYSNLESPRALPDAYYLARVGEVYVGEADLRRPLEGSHLMHNVTGVLPAWRGRGIAMALKLATIAYAQRHGYAEIRTHNEVRNAGMPAINERLGFARQPAWITFERAFDA